jgi:hypothetical protein
LEDIYESFAFVSLFLLFLHSLEPEPALWEQYFHKLENQTRKGRFKAGGSL